MTVKRIGHGVDGRGNTLLKWKYLIEVTCDVEKLGIFLRFKKENEGDYRFIQRKNHSTYAAGSYADASLVMIGKGSFYLLHFNFFSCKNSSNYNKSMLVLLFCYI